MTEPDKFDKSLLDIWELREGKSIESTDFTVFPTLSKKYYPLDISEEDGDGFIIGVGEIESTDKNPIAWTNDILDKNNPEIREFTFPTDVEVDGHEYYKPLTPEGKNIINSAKRDDVTEELEYVNHFVPNNFSRSRGDFFVFKHPETDQFCLAKAEYTIFSEIEVDNGQKHYGYHTFSDRETAKNKTLLLTPDQESCEIYKSNKSVTTSPYSRPKDTRTYINKRSQMGSSIQNPPIKVVPDKLKLDKTKYNLKSSSWSSPFDYSNRIPNAGLILALTIFAVGVLSSSPILILSSIALVLASGVLRRILEMSKADIELPFEFTPTEEVPNYISESSRTSTESSVTIENDHATWSIELDDKATQIDIFDYFIQSGFEKTQGNSFVGYIIPAELYEYDGETALLSDCGNWYLLPESKLMDVDPEHIQVVTNTVDAPQLDFTRDILGDDITGTENVAGADDISREEHTDEELLLDEN